MFSPLAVRVLRRKVFSGVAWTFNTVPASTLSPLLTSWPSAVVTLREPCAGSGVVKRMAYVGSNAQTIFTSLSLTVYFLVPKMFSPLAVRVLRRKVFSGVAWTFNTVPSGTSSPLRTSWPSAVVTLRVPCAGSGVVKRMAYAFSTSQTIATSFPLTAYFFEAKMSSPLAVRFLIL